MFFINEVVEAMDLAAFESRYAVVGEHTYPPRLLLKLWLSGVMQVVYSGQFVGSNAAPEACGEEGVISLRQCIPR